MKLARRLIPAGLYESLSIVRRHRRSVARDAAFKARLEQYTIGPARIANLKVLPDRDELLKQLPKGATMAEVGVARGEFTRQILDVCRPAKLYLIDLWAADSARYANLMEGVRELAAKEIADGTVEILRGYSWDMLATLPDGVLDFAYIDAAHDYDSVAKDLRAAEPKMAPGGIIAGHDYTRWSSNGLHRWGVVEAVNEFANERGWDMIYLTNEPGRHLSYALRRSADAGASVQPGKS